MDGGNGPLEIGDAEMSNINRPIIWNAEKGIVTGETEKRGRILLTVTLASGREIKVALASVEFADVPRFAPPATFSELAADYRADNAARRRLMGIG